MSTISCSPSQTYQRCRSVMPTASRSFLFWREFGKSIWRIPRCPRPDIPGTILHDGDDITMPPADDRRDWRREATPQRQIPGCLSTRPIRSNDRMDIDGRTGARRFGAAADCGVGRSRRATGHELHLVPNSRDFVPISDCSPSLPTRASADGRVLIGSLNCRGARGLPLTRASLSRDAIGFRKHGCHTPLCIGRTASAARRVG